MFEISLELKNIKKSFEEAVSRPKAHATSMKPASPSGSYSS